MNENRQKTTESAREEYLAPTYERFAFETSDLLQASGDPQPGALGSYNHDFGLFSKGGNTPSNSPW